MYDEYDLQIRYPNCVNRNSYVVAVQNERQPRNSAQVRQEQLEAELDNPLLSTATVSATHPAFQPSLTNSGCAPTLPTPAQLRYATSGPYTTGHVEHHTSNHSSKVEPDENGKMIKELQSP